MTRNDLLLDIFSSYLERYNQSIISFSQLVPFMERYSLEHPEVEADVMALTRGNLRSLISSVDALDLDGIIQVIRKDAIPVSVVYPQHFIKRIRQFYARIDEKPEVPFPTESVLNIAVPMDQIQTVDIKSDFMQWLVKDEKAGDKVLKLNFPDGIGSMICTIETLKTRVLVGAVHKIRHYLKDPKNLAYTRQKLTPMLKGKELAVKDLLHSIVTAPEVACSTVLEPTDFSFHLWTQLSSNIIKEFAQKVDKLSEEHGFCQAAYLIGYYNVYYRGIITRKREEEMAVNVLIQGLRKSPFAFRITDMYEFKDDKGLLIINKLDREKINQVIRQKLLPSANKDTPEIIRLNTSKDEAYFMLFTSVPQMVSELIIRSQKEMREFYQRSWTLSLKQDIEFTTMLQDEEFIKHIQFRVKTHYPLLECLLDYKILLLAGRLDGIPENYRNDLLSLIDTGSQKVKTLDQIFRLNRKRMLDDARMLLPAWMVVPVIKGIVRFFRMLFLGPELANKPYAAIFDHEGQERVQQVKKPKKQKTGDESKNRTQDETGNQDQDEESARQANAKQQAIKYHEAAKELESEFLPHGLSIQASMYQLIDRWNNILDKQTKDNLTQDVNSLCKDYLRKMRITTKSKLPTPGDVRAYAIKVWETETLLKIRNRKDLLRYLEIYILHLLENLP